MKMKGIIDVWVWIHEREGRHIDAPVSRKRLDILYWGLRLVDVYATQHRTRGDF